MKYEPDDPIILEHLGDIYYKKGLKGKALFQWERALKLDPKRTEIKEKIRKVRKEIER